MSLHGLFAAERADVFGVLCDFHLLDLLAERCTVSAVIRSVLAPQIVNLLLLVARDNCLRVSRRMFSIPKCPQPKSNQEITYLVPYLPVTPTFFVRFVIFAECTEMKRDLENEGARRS